MIRLLLFITFVESLVTSLVERGILFYAEDQLDFSRSLNLWLALLFGLSYMAGAFVSHGAAHRFGERRWLMGMVLGHIVLNLSLATEPGALWVFILNSLLGFTSGSKWPVVESYVSAGLTPRQAMTTIGRFNMSWSSAVVIAVAISGMLIEFWPPSLFLFPGSVNIGVFFILFLLPKRPTHLEQDHPDRPTERQVARLKSLLASSRWSMFGSYTLLFLLATQQPFIFGDRLKIDTGPATAYSSAIDLARFLTFFVMWLWIGWHGKRWVLILGTILLPAGFLLTLLGANLPTVLVGELLFGIAAGITYYAALYYALVVENAAVEAGGAHEGLIGSGFAVGPGLGLIGVYIGAAGAGSAGLIALSSSPFLIICAGASIWMLRGAKMGDHFHFPE